MFRADVLAMLACYWPMYWIYCRFFGFRLSNGSFEGRLSYASPGFVGTAACLGTYVPSLDGTGWLVPGIACWGLFSVIVAWQCGGF